MITNEWNLCNHSALFWCAPIELEPALFARCHLRFSSRDADEFVAYEMA